MKTRIVVLAHSSNIGGAELALRSLILSTQNLYEWVVVFPSLNKADPMLLEGVERAYYIPLPWWCYELQGSAPVSFSPRLKQSINKLKKIANTADVLLTNTITIPWLGLMSQKINKPHIWYVHEFGNIDHDLQFVLGYKESLQMIDACSDRVLTISEAVKQHLSSTIPEVKIDLINQSIDLANLMTIPPVSPYNQEKGLRLLCMGAIKPSKGQMVAVQALSLTPQPHTLKIVGAAADQKYTENIKQQAKDLNNVTVEIKRFDPAVELACCDVLIMCSENEAMGRVTIEALAAGRIVVGFDCPSTKAILSNNRGLLYSPNTPEALAGALNTLHGEPTKLINVKKNRQYVAKTYSDTKQSSDFKKCLGKITHNQATKPGSLDVYLSALDSKHLLASSLSLAKSRTLKIIRRLVS